jgi:hypothetical protein
MDIPCECTTVQQADGSIKCTQCNGDFYACECPAHKANCPEKAEDDQLEHIWADQLLPDNEAEN